MKTSPQNIRVLHPVYSPDSTARELDDEYYSSVSPHADPTIGTKSNQPKTGRDQLKVISGQFKRASVGYSAFVLAIPVVALLIVLVVNIVMSNRQYEMVELNSQLTQITQSNESLAQEVSQKSAPQSVAQQAADMGMVLPGTAASIDLSTGDVVGTATAASEENTPTNFVSEPTVRSSTGIPSEVEAPVQTDLEPVKIRNGDVPGPESNTVKIIGPQITVPDQNVANATAENGVADSVQTSSVGSLQGPQVSLPADN